MIVVLDKRKVKEELQEVEKDNLKLLLNILNTIPMIYTVKILKLTSIIDYRILIKLSQSNKVILKYLKAKF
jgi:hypothetical protein